MPEVSKTTDQALNLLEFLGDRGSLSIAEVARETGLSRTVAYRLLSTLEQRGFVRRSDGIYRLGPKLFALAQHVEWAVRDAAHPFMASLVEELRETVVLVVRDGSEALSVHRIVSRDHILQVSYPPGRRYPLTDSIAGRVILAFTSTEERRRMFPDTSESSDAELTKIRRRGFAVGNDDRVPGLTAIAAPIRSMDGVAASIVVMAPVDRAPGLRSAKDSILEAADAISHQLTNE